MTISIRCEKLDDAISIRYVIEKAFNRDAKANLVDIGRNWHSRMPAGGLRCDFCPRRPYFLLALRFYSCLKIQH
jgi:hypothetical protein